MDLNKFMGIGRIGRNPETRTVGGKTLASFSVATSYGTGDNQRTAWHQVTAWEKLAEIAVQILHKGDRVYIEGRVEYNTVGEGEAKKTYSQIVLTNLINLTPKAAGTDNATTGTTTPQAAAAVEEDIPF